MCRHTAALLSLLVALAVVGGAAAEKVQKTKADQAAAVRDVLKRSQLPPGIPWKAAKAPPAHSGKGSCVGYDPKTTSIETGASSSRFTARGLDVASEAALMKTTKMVNADWKKVVVPALIPCLRKSFEKGAGGKAKVISVKKLSFPALARHTAAYRLIARVTSKGKTGNVGVDVIVIGANRTELTLFVTAALGQTAQLKKAEVDLSALDIYLGEKVAARAFAGTA